MPERRHYIEETRLLAEMLRFHSHEDVSLDQISRETGLDRATTHRLVQLIEHVGALAPEVETTNDSVRVGSYRYETPTLFDGEVTEVLSYLFARVRTIHPVNINDHEYLKSRPDGVNTAVEHGWVTTENETIALTPAGTGYIGPRYSRWVNGRPD